MDYIVNDLCNPSVLVSPDIVRTASGSLTRERISQILGFQYEGDFARITTTATTAATPDRKLWLIGATLGPVAFVLLLIFVCCFLHYKCRPRATSRPLTKVQHSIEFLHRTRSRCFAFLGNRCATSSVRKKHSKCSSNASCILNDLIVTFKLDLSESP